MATDVDTPSSSAPEHETANAAAQLDGMLEPSCSDRTAAAHNDDGAHRDLGQQAAAGADVRDAQRVSGDQPSIPDDMRHDGTSPRSALHEPEAGGKQMPVAVQSRRAGPAPQAAASSAALDGSAAAAAPSQQPHESAIDLEDELEAGTAGPAAASAPARVQRPAAGKAQGQRRKRSDGSASPGARSPQGGADKQPSGKRNRSSRRKQESSSSKVIPASELLHAGTSAAAKSATQVGSALPQSHDNDVWPEGALEVPVALQ